MADQAELRAQVLWVRKQVTPEPEYVGKEVSTSEPDWH